MLVEINTLLYALSKGFDYVEKELFGVSSGHSKRVAYMSMKMCSYFAMDKEIVCDTASCAILHDNALTEYMQHKHHDKLTKLESIESHCIAGENNVENFPFFANPENYILQHHENWNGTGYFKFKGKEIVKSASMIHLADSIDVIFNLGDAVNYAHESVIAHVRKERERMYDPEVADAFLAIANDDFFADLYRPNIDLILKNTTPNIAKEMTKENILAMCKMFAKIIDAKSTFTLNHSKGIAEIAEKMADFYDFDPEHSTKFVVSAYLHDIGKLSVPTYLLDKPSALTPNEFDIIRGHAQSSYDILSVIEGFEEIAFWASSHHEKLNGKGYPNGLKILPFEAKLLACIDVYQAVTEDRPYRAGMSHERAMQILEKMVEYNDLDPRIVADLDIVLMS